MPANLTQEIDHLHELQSKALFFANEAYHIRQAAMHIVLNQQLKLRVALSPTDYLLSISEQMGFAMEQITSKKDLGTALWKSAKYIDRVSDAISQINNPRRQNQLPAIFNEATLGQIEQVKMTSAELLKIKKGEEDYYGLNDAAKASRALEVGKGYPFPVDSIQQVRAGLLKFDNEINAQFRNAFPEEFTANPSALNQYPVIGPKQMEEFYRPIPEEQGAVPGDGKDVAQVPVQDWGLETIA